MNLIRGVQMTYYFIWVCSSLVCSLPFCCIFLFVEAQKLGWFLNPEHCISIVNYALGQNFHIHIRADSRFWKYCQGIAMMERICTESWFYFGSEVRLWNTTLTMLPKCWLSLGIAWEIAWVYKQTSSWNFTSLLLWLLNSLMLTISLFFVMVVF